MISSEKDELEKLYCKASIKAARLKRKLKKSKSEVKVMKKKMKANEEKFDTYKDTVRCPVCTEVIVGCCTLGCGHNFCYPCAIKWGTTKGDCPMCRQSYDPESLRINVLVENICQIVYGMMDEDEKKAYDERHKEYMDLKNHYEFKFSFDRLGEDVEAQLAREQQEVQDRIDRSVRGRDAVNNMADDDSSSDSDNIVDLMDSSSE